MFGIKKLLVGIALVPSDENPDELTVPPPTREAINVALQVAAAPGSELTFFAVNESSPLSDDGGVASHIQRVLETFVDEAAQGNVTARCAVASGYPWMEIIREVRRNGHQMVFVGSRTPTLTRRLLLGSTSTKLLRKCPCPVWVVRPGTSAGIKTVVVTDELSDVGERCVQLGVSAARLLNARLLVLHAVQYGLEGHLRRTGTSEQEVEIYRKKTRIGAEQILNDHLSMTDYRTLTQGTQVQITAGPPEVVIEDAINEHQADLLVMGTVARGGIPGLLVGNTAERLLPVINCSLIAVKPVDFVCPIPLD